MVVEREHDSLPSRAESRERTVGVDGEIIITEGGGLAMTDDG